jgi:hypothetical protein
VTQRANARIAGYAYLSYIVFAMLSSVLFGKATAGDNVSQTLSTLARMIWVARVTVLLDLLQPVCALVLAVTLYRLVNAVNPTLALIAMLFRAGEGLLGSLPLLSKLELMRLATTPDAGPANASGYLALADEVLHRPDGGFSAFCFVVGGFLFACLFLKGRSIPRWLAWIGVVTIAMQLICVPLHIATMIPESIENWLWFPILLYEVPLGIWLIVKGIKSPPGSQIAEAGDV